jgi:protein-S-isoprenylcysteine O-methyltransferase Ste14
MPPSISAPAPLAIQPTAVSKLLGAATYFIIRRRIFLSFVLFTVLIADDVWRGVRPHDVFDLYDPVSVAGVLLVVIGLALRSWAVGILRKDKELTTNGPYRLVRNPLYLGSFLMMFGFCALINDLRNFLFVLGPVLLLYIVKVRNEERWLSKLFPAQFAQYARQTPRFLPRLARTDMLAQWSTSQWLRSREYQAVTAALVALVAIKVWQTLG